MNVGVVRYTVTVEGKRTEKTAEIDFVANKCSRGLRTVGFQYGVPKKRMMGLRPFLKIDDSFKKLVAVVGRRAPREKRMVWSPGGVGFLDGREQP